MNAYAVEDIVLRLKAARERKGLSQRAFGKLAGLPQSHISKIESGSVDLRLSSLIELTRVLGLDLVLVPRKAIPAVKAIITGVTQGADALAQGSPHAPVLDAVLPAYTLDDEDDA